MNSETIRFETQRFPVTTFAAANFAETLAYYGFTSSALFFLMNTYFASDKNWLFRVYSLIPFVISILSIAGGIIGDFLLGSRRAVIVGSVLQCFGYLIMSVSDKTVFIFGLGILIIGRGLYSPNITSLLGIVSRKDNITTESTMLTQMVAASFAGFCAPFLFGILNRDSLFFISLFAGFTTLVPAVLFFFTKNVRLTNLDTQNSKLNDNTNMPLTDLRILILTLGAGLCFNLMKNYGSSDFLAQFSDVSYHKNIFRNTALVDGFAYLIIATLFAIVWNFFKLSPYIKLFLGFVLYSFALYSFNLVKNLTPDSMVFVTVQLLVVLEVICQLLIFPTLTALLLDNAPLKLLSTSVAVYLFLFQVLNITTMQFKHSLNLIGITQQPLLMAGFSVLLALLSILNYIHKKKAQSRPLT